MIRAITLFGSSRRHENTGRLVDCIAKRVGIEVVDLATKRLSPYDYEHRNRGDDFEPLMRRVLGFDQIIFASPVYWYAVCPPMKVFFDRISDFLDLPDLIDEGRQLRGKRAYVACTSIYAEVPKPSIGAFVDTFDYLGMRFGGLVHANCRDGYAPAEHDADACKFVQLVRSHADDAEREPDPPPECGGHRRQRRGVTRFNGPSLES
jgi:multimeric flavodoxin WrbA